MIDMPTSSIALQVASSLPHCPLKIILLRQIANAKENGLTDMTHMLVVQPGDTEAKIIEAVGISPISTRIENSPSYIQRHPGWWEVIYTVGNSGFAYILFVHQNWSTEFNSLAGSQ